MLTLRQVQPISESADDGSVSGPMAQPPAFVEYERQKEDRMHILFASLTIAFVVLVLLLVAFVLFTMSPFARHGDSFHEPGQRQNSPRLD
jgi:hypothetical protein